MPRGSGSLLAARGIDVLFDGLQALSGVDLVLKEGEILGLIGPNGAGKTTLVDVLSGFRKPSRGTVSIDQRDVTHLPAHTLARLGLARSFQAGRLFGDLTVLENVEAAALCHGGRRREAARLAKELLMRMEFQGKAAVRANALPAGDQRRLSLLRALALAPTFLLLDEPAAGLNELESLELVRAIRAIRDRFGCGILVIDHDMRVIMPLCERIQVLNYGETLFVGPPGDVRSHPAVIEAYLGVQRS